MIKKSIVIFSFFIAFLLALEDLLKRRGYQPGHIITEGLDLEGNLKFLPNIFTTDSFGVYAVDYKAIRALKSSYDLCNRKLNIAFDSDNFENIFYDAACLQRELNLIEDSCSVCLDKIQNYPFRDYLMANRNDEQYQYLLEYIKDPINKEGFRSIPFDRYENTDKIKVLLIGDSYAWGLSAEPIFNSYADVLLSKGYLVFNTGISGTDPAQYSAIAKKYIPILKPDIVLVNFYVANDFMFYKRPPLMSEPIEYATNEGFILSAPYGKFLTFDEDVKYYKSLTTLPDREKDSFNNWCSRSRVCSSLLWPILVSVGARNHKELVDYKERLNLPLLERAKITQTYIDEIQNTAIAAQVPCAFVVIPETPLVWCDEQIFINEGKNKNALDLVFEHTGYYFPEMFSKKDNSPNGHFNNQGAAKFAAYMDRIIHEKLKL